MPLEITVKVPPADRPHENVTTHPMFRYNEGMPPSRKDRPIRLEGVRQNNLKGVRVEFPARKMTVVTGLSGSGKSSLVFDTLYAEGQRRYIESLSTYTRQFLEKMPKPDLDKVENIPPAIALEQRNTVVGSRSTVGSQTEVIDYLRILFARTGETFCVKCGGAVKKIDHEIILDQALGWMKGRKSGIVAPVPTRALDLLAPQGFSRVLWIQGKAHQVFTLDEKIPTKNKKKGDFYVVVDRFKLKPKVTGQTRTRIADSIRQALLVGRDRMTLFDFDSGLKKNYDCRFACVSCGHPHPLPSPQLFSFNSPIGACSRCNGFGHTLDLDEALVVPDPNKTLRDGAIDPFSKPSLEDWQKDLFKFAEKHGISIGKRYRELTASQKLLLWEGHAKDKTFPGVLACFKRMERWKYKIHVRVFIRRYQSQTLCPECQGARLNPYARAVLVAGKNLADIQGLAITESLKWIKKLKPNPASAEIISQVGRRLDYMAAVGVGYLTLERQTKTLSGGEFQRINLATQLGNGLCGTLYVLDEPSIGLHASDTEKLVAVLEDLRNQGNTLVIVEHDMGVIERADWLIEMGPGAGRLGGKVVAQGTAQQLAKTNSLTGRFLAGTDKIERPVAHRPKAAQFLRLKGCTQNNLKNIDVSFPLARFVVVTGMSGSGKSTLVHQTLYPALGRMFESQVGPMRYRRVEQPGAFKSMHGADQLAGVVLLDQKPIGKNSRSNPATYLKAWDEVRRLLANQVVSLRRGYTPQHFSFNVDGGRCPVCKGEGEITLDMHFMAEMKLPCEECNGRRFKKKLLDVLYKGKNVHDILNMTINDAYDLFRQNHVLARKLGILREVGLGYLLVGQPAPTLSGGESQRLKIAAVLDAGQQRRMLYLFDEPTTGLHQADIQKLLTVLQDLVESGNSIVMIEHHLDVIAQSDWIIDLGPGGGEHGGRVIAQGSPAAMTKNDLSVTGQVLNTHGYQPSPNPHFNERSVGL